MTNHYWIIRPKFHTIFVIFGFVGIGALLSFVEYLNNIAMGYIIAGIVLMMSYKWEYYEDK